MIISKIEYENFRNFKEKGEIRCSTDGKVTIIYGKNGTGKTTFHQLIQWVFYGQVHFNKTATAHLYNLSYEAERSYGETFDVMGRIDFNQDGIQYSLTRKQTYKKDIDDSVKIAEDLSLLRMDEDKNWKRLDKPNEAIEQFLPPGLSDYFFFDGESMIADLKLKGKDSAGKLKKALYSIFDLDVIESAINHIGRIDLKTTVLGKLYHKKGNISSNGNITAANTNIINAQNKLEKYEQNINAAQEKKEQCQEIVRSASEKIGSTTSKEEYEKQRKDLKNQRDVFIKNYDQAQAAFGDEVMSMFPQLLISKAVEDAKKTINLRINQNKLPAGVSKKLISYLLKESTTECICGNPLCEESRNHIKAYLDLLPPKSYSSLYNEFTTTARYWGKGYDRDRIDACIKSVVENQAQAEKCDYRIRELDEEEKKSPDIEDLVIARRNAELRIKELDESIEKWKVEKKKCEIYLKQQMKIYDELTKSTQEGKIVSARIDIMEQVLSYFKKKLDDESVRFSKKLEKSIQYLIDNMLTSKRSVTVSSEFSVRVTDSYNDESKSEGQFAVVSFAYIGGILKMLQSEDNLSSKEYPLVLDGPFSKLDPDQRQNVANMIPDFAPQVILFSKDDLQDVFSADSIGRVWTIVSNDEKNIAKVEEGYLWK